MLNKKRIAVIVSFLILSFVLITYGATRGNARVDVTFYDGFDNKIIDEQIIGVGEDAEVPNEPIHENYVFAGWYLYDSIDTLITNFENIEEDLRVEARYEGDLNNNGIADKNEGYYNVRFIDGVTNEILKTEQVLPGLGATSPEPLFHDGYTYLGWSVDYSNINSDLDVISNYNLNIVPNVTPQEIVMHTLRFHDKNGEIFNTQTVAANNAGTSVDVPQYDGYTFVGWYLDEEKTIPYLIGSLVTSDLDIYGKWEINTYEIIIDPKEGYLDGGNAPIDKKQEKEYGETFKLPNAINTYTLTYHANGKDAEVIGNNSVVRNAILLGWCNKTSCTNEELIAVGTEVIVENNIKYTAVWGKAESNITLTNALRKSTESTNYAFEGWSTSETGNKDYSYNNEITLEQDMDLYAVWTESARKYNVELEGKIDPENNPSKIENEQEKEYGETFKLPNAIRTYTLTYDLNGGTTLNGDKINNVSVEFEGWCIKNETCDTYLSVDSIQTVNKNIVYVPMFKSHSKAINLITASKDADKINTYKFVGWSKDKNATTADYSINFINNDVLNINDDLVLYAVWKEEAIKYNLTINTNGGVISENDKLESSYVYDTELKLPTPTKKYTLSYNTNGGEKISDEIANVEFLGWCEGNTTSCDKYASNIKIDDNKEYTAVWGSASSITLPKAVKNLKNGIKYTFKEWYYGNPEVRKLENEKLILTNDLTISAKYLETAVIKIDLNGGSIVNNPTNLVNGDNTYEVGTEIDLPNLKKNYTLKYVVGSGTLLNGAKESNDVEITLLGWCNKAICTNEELLPALQKVNVESNKTYKAVWGEAKSQIAIADADKTDTKEYDYTFDGWTLTNEANAVVQYHAGDLKLLTEDLVLYAKYSNVKQKYDVIINGKIDENNNPSDLNVNNNLDYGTKYNLPQAIKDYTLTYHVGGGTLNNNDAILVKRASFLGWCANSTSCTLTELITSDQQEVTNNITYNPIFGPAINSIKIANVLGYSDKVNTYTFVGWSTTEGGTVDLKYSVNEDVKLESDLHLYAIYSSHKNEYKLAFNPNGGIISNENNIKTTYEYNEQTNAFPIPTKSYTLTYDANGGTLDTNTYKNVANLTFLGWCEGNTTSCDKYVTSTVMDDNKTYTAVWSDAEKIDLITASHTSTLENTYEFDAWYDETIKYKNSIILTKNTILTASYNKNTRYYEVCFDSKYDKENLPENQNVTYNSLVTPVDNLESTDHVFIEWTNNNVTWDFNNDKVTKDGITLIAKWSNKLTFDLMGGTVKGFLPNALQEDGAKIKLPDLKKLYTLTYEVNGGEKIQSEMVSAQFLGWCKNAKNCENPLLPNTEETINANTTYYAVWGNGTKTIKLPTAVKKMDNVYSYEFKGWSIANDGNVNYNANHDLLINSDTTLYAVWNSIKREYELTLNSNGGTIDNSNMIDTTYEYNEQTSAFPTPKLEYTLTYDTDGGSLDTEDYKNKSNAQFLGWCEGNTASCDEYVTSTVMDDNKTYTAAWGASEETITLIGANKSSTIDTVYEFKEWYYLDNTNEIVKTKGETINLSKDLTVKARYNANPRNYTVIFENNNYGIKPSNQVIEFNNKVSNPGSLAQNGFTFDNWYKDSNLKTPWIYDVDTVNENTIDSDGNVHIYGNMIRNNYKLQITVTGETANYNVNYEIGNDNKYVIPFDSNVKITGINPKNGYYVSDIKLNNVSQSITSGTHEFEFNMPSKDTHVEIVLTKLTNNEIGRISPIRAFYIEDSWVDVRLNQPYMTLNGTRKICIRGWIWCEEYVDYPNYDTTTFVPEFYYSKQAVNAETYLLNPNANYNWIKYSNVAEKWLDDSSQVEISNLEVDGGWHYHLDNIKTDKRTKLADYKYFYVVYIENGYRYIIEYQRTTGNNYTIVNFFSIKVS